MFCPNKCGNDRFHTIKVYREKHYNEETGKKEYSSAKDLRKLVCRGCGHVFFTETKQLNINVKEFYKNELET